MFDGPLPEAIKFLYSHVPPPSVYRDKSADTQLNVVEVEVMPNNIKRFVVKDPI